MAFTIEVIEVGDSYYVDAQGIPTTVDQAVTIGRHVTVAVVAGRTGKRVAKAGEPEILTLHIPDPVSDAAIVSAVKALLVKAAPEHSMVGRQLEVT